MNNDRRAFDLQHGFSLVEVLIAMLLFMLIMLGLGKGEIAAISTNSSNLFRTEALRLAEEELTRLKGEQFSVNGTSAALAAAAWPVLPNNIIVPMRSGSTTYARSVQIVDIAASATSLKRIDVAVGWTHGNSGVLLAPTNRNHQVSLSTIIVLDE